MFFALFISSLSTSFATDFKCRASCEIAQQQQKQWSRKSVAKRPSMPEQLSLVSRLRNLPFSLRMVFLSNAFVTGENDVNAQSTGFSPIASAFLPTISGVPQQARIKEPGSLRQAKRPDENRPISLKCTSQFALNVIYTNKSTVFVLAVSAPRFIDALHN